MLDLPSAEEPFLNTQPDLLLMQFHAAPSGPAAVPREKRSAPAPLLPLSKQHLCQQALKTVFIVIMKMISNKNFSRQFEDELN